MPGTMKKAMRKPKKKAMPKKKRKIITYRYYLES